MKKIRSLAALLIGASAWSFAADSRASSFDDIQLWAGSGTNQAALVIDWTSGAASESLIWGYRWDGTATGEQMLYAIMGVDPRLYAEVSGSTEFGTALFGLGYDLNGNNPFTLSPDLSFNRQHLAYADYGTVDDGRTAASSGDLWLEGWLSAGYWSYWTSTESRLSADFSDWDYSSVGMSSRELEDGDVDGWTFDYDFTWPAPTPEVPLDVAPVPEPGSWVMLLLGGFGLIVLRKNMFQTKNKNKIVAGVLVSTLLATAQARATSLDDIQFWTGTGTNRAALVIYWSAPEVRNNTSVPNPAAEKSLVWGYRFNGTATAEAMFNAIAAADQRLTVTATTPYPGFGAFVYSLGYDLNNNGVFGQRFGTNTFAENAFTNGQRVLSTEDPDNTQPLDWGDLLWSGSFGPNWEMWQEQGGAGGFTNAPDRGVAPYWTALDTDYFSYGYQGQWDYDGSGLEGTSLYDGSWIGFTVAAGGLNYSDPDDPGTIAYDYHKHAPIAPEPATTNSAYVTQILSSQGPFGNSPYDDPNCILGAPSTHFFESNTKPATRVKVVEPAYNYSVDNGVTNKLIVTMNTGSAIIAKFDHAVYDNPANPYGVDFEVFGNAFYTGNGFSSDMANLNTYLLTSGGFYEPTKVSVSPGYTGQPGEVQNDPTTWPWYRYDNGPYDDTDCPTEGYRWNRTGTNWTDEVMDFTKPVNPMLKAKLNTSGRTLSAADAIDLYDGSGGGTAFDLKESGFTSVQYVKVEGLDGFTGGEVDAFSIVRPMTIGDTLSISPANITNGTATLSFQKPGAENETILSLAFTNVSDIAQVSTKWLGDDAALAALPGKPLQAIQLQLAAILNTNAVTFQADLTLSPGVDYTGNGNDLRVFGWDGTNWNKQSFIFTNAAAVVGGVTHLGAFALAQFTAPALQLQPGTNGFTCQFTPVMACEQVVERSTDLVTWTPVTSFTPTNSAPITLTDSNAPADKAFYRLRLNLP